MTIAHGALKALLAAACLAAVCIAASAPAHAQHRRSILERYQTYQEFDQRQFGFVQNGYHVMDLETCREPGAVWWVAVYEHFTEPPMPAGFGQFVEAGSWTALMQETGRLAREGWFIDDLNAASDGSGWTHHVAIFNEWPGSNQHIIREADFATFNLIRERQGAFGLRLVDIDVSNINGQTLFYGVQRSGTHEERLIHENTWASFNTVRAHMESNGWRVRDIAIQEGEFFAVLNQGSGPSLTETYQDWPSLLNRWAAIDGNRRVTTRIKDVECWSEGGQLRYAALYRGAPRRVGQEARPPNVVRERAPAQPTPTPAPAGPVADPDPN
jgi:hypothetical protein